MWIMRCRLFQIKERRIRFRYNLGSGEEMVHLAHVDVTEGQWHTVKVQVRAVRAAELRIG